MLAIHFDCLHTSMSFVPLKLSDFPCPNTFFGFLKNLIALIQSYLLSEPDNASGFLSKFKTVRDVNEPRANRVNNQLLVKQKQ